MDECDGHTNPATSQDARLVRYQVLAANRRYFGNLFFAVVAFSWIFGLAVWVTVTWAYPNTSALAYLVTGSIVGAGGFVAHRLLKRERSSFDAMCACWNTFSGVQPVADYRPAPPGAMAIVVMGQMIIGATMLAVSAALS